MAATHVKNAPGDIATDRQLEIFALIYESARNHGYQPSVRELCDLTGITSPNGIVGHIDALEAKGYVKADKNAARCLTILRKPDGTPFRGFEAK